MGACYTWHDVDFFCSFNRKKKKKFQTKVLVNWNLVLKRFRIIQVLEGFRMCAVDGSCQVRSWHVPWAAL